MGNGAIHTVYRDGRWVNEAEGEDKIGGVHATKEEAVSTGRARAQQDHVDHVIHNEDGTVGERSSYGADPATRKG
jgi:Uncharacterized protein conserved in bacteria (DUF2188)